MADAKSTGALPSGTRYVTLTRDDYYMIGYRQGMADERNSRLARKCDELRGRIAELESEKADLEDLVETLQAEGAGQR